MGHCDAAAARVGHDSDCNLCKNQHRLSLHNSITLQAIEPLMKPSAIFATNTSALPIAEIAKASKRPERVVGKSAV